MPNFAAVLRSEISRIARKEIRVSTASLVKTNRGNRTELAALKRRVHELELATKRSARPQGSESVQAVTPKSRFSAKSMLAQRKRLGLSAEAFGKLVGASGNTVYNWESGATKPRAKFLSAISATRGLGKREAKAALERKSG